MRGRGWLWLSALFLLVYTAYVVVAKFGKLVGVKIPFELGNVGEFWLFTAFIGAFCLQIIRDERALRTEAEGHADKATAQSPQSQSQSITPEKRGSAP
jgi:uncharacterized membrane protein (DUF485 family)